MPLPITPWLDRTFPTGLPIALWRPTLERVRGTPARLEAWLAGRKPSALTRARGEGWTVQQHAGHLLDLEPLWAKRLAELVARVDVLTAADMSNRRTEEADHNATPLATILEAFRMTRTALVAGFDSLDADQVRYAARHPRLGQPMTALDLAFVVAEHDDHHLAWIGELLGP